MEDANQRTKSIARKGFYIFLSTLLIILMFYTTSMLQPKSLDLYHIDTSHRHVEDLIVYWKSEKLEQEKLTKSNNSNHQTISKAEYVHISYDNAEYRKHYQSPRELASTIKSYKSKLLREKYQDEVSELAKKTSGTPHIIKYDLGKETQASNTFECVNLKIKPTTPICLYDSNEDIFVSKQIRDLGVWEKHIVLKFQEILRKGPSLGVIDLGANIGQYSLIAAKMGHKVLAVEPWLPSLERFAKAATLANTSENIHVLKNTIADVRKKIFLGTTNSNKGDVHIAKSKEVSQRAECFPSQSIYIDDLVEFIDFDKALLKIDIQGYEHRSFLHAEKLLDKIFVPYVIMEWVIMRELWVTASHNSLDKAMVDHLVNLMTRLDYGVFSLVSGKQLDIRYWHGWPEDIIWVHKSEIKQYHQQNR